MTYTSGTFQMRPADVESSC